MHKHNHSTKSERYKDAFKTYARMKKLWNAQRNLGWDDLPEPMFIGYAKTFRLRDDYTRRADVNFWKDVLELVNNSVKCKSKDFMHRNSLTNRWEAVVLNTQGIKESQLLKLPEKTQSLFHAGKVSKLRREKMFFLNHPYYLVPVIHKDYITKIRQTDHDIDKELALLANHMKQSNLWKELGYGHNQYKREIEGKIAGLKKAALKDFHEGVSSFDGNIVKFKIR